MERVREQLVIRGRQLESHTAAVRRHQRVIAYEGALWRRENLEAHPFRGRRLLTKVDEGQGRGYDNRQRGDDPGRRCQP